MKYQQLLHLRRHCHSLGQWSKQPYGIRGRPSAPHLLRVLCTFALLKSPTHQYDTGSESSVRVLPTTAHRYFPSRKASAPGCASPPPVRDEEAHCSHASPQSYCTPAWSRDHQGSSFTAAGVRMLCATRSSVISYSRARGKLAFLTLLPKGIS